MAQQNNDSPIKRILGGLGHAAHAFSEASAAVAKGRCVNCPAEIRPRSSWFRRDEPQRKQLLCDECALAAGEATAGVVGKVVQRGLSTVLGEMFAGRERGGDDDK